MVPCRGIGKAVRDKNGQIRVSFRARFCAFDRLDSGGSPIVRKPPYCQWRSVHKNTQVSCEKPPHAESMRIYYVHRTFEIVKERIGGICESFTPQVQLIESE